MKHALAGLALGVLLCSPLLCTPALADTSIATPAFTITYIDGPVPEDWSITQVDRFPNTYSFSLDTLNDRLAGTEAYDLSGAGAFAETSSWSTFRLDIDPGYRVSRIALTGIAFGELSPGQLPDFPPGIVHNVANAFLTVDRTMNWGSLHSDFQAENVIELDSPPLDLTGMAEVSVSGTLLAQAWGVEGGGAFAESYASASLRNLELHVEVSPIPEPQAWLMLGAGLGIVGCLARPRRFARPAPEETP